MRCVLPISCLKSRNLLASHLGALLGEINGRYTRARQARVPAFSYGLLLPSLASLNALPVMVARFLFVL